MAFQICDYDLFGRTTMDDPLAPNAAQAATDHDRKLLEAAKAVTKREQENTRALTGALNSVMDNPTSLDAISGLRAVLLEHQFLPLVHAFENRIVCFLSLDASEQAKFDCMYARKNYRGGPHPLSADDYAKRMRDIGFGCRLLTGETPSQSQANRMSPSIWGDVVSEIDATCRRDPQQLAELRKLPVSRPKEVLDLRDQTPQKNASFGEGGGTRNDAGTVDEKATADDSLETRFKEETSGFRESQWCEKLDRRYAVRAKEGRGRKTRSFYIPGLGGIYYGDGRTYVFRKDKTLGYRSLTVTHSERIGKKIALEFALHRR